MFTHHEKLLTTSTCDKLYTQSWVPSGPVIGCVLLVHGLTEHSGRYHPIAEYLVNKSYAVFALDHEGHGQSSGRRGHIASFKNYFAGITALRELASATISDKPMYIIGHSMGGVITLNYVLDNHQYFKGFALSGPALDTEGVISPIQKYLLHGMAAVIPKFGALKLETGELTHDPEMNASHDADPLILRDTVSAKLVSEIIKYAESGLKRAASLKTPVLIMHGEADSLASVNGSTKLHSVIGSEDKTLKIYDGMFHEIFLEIERKTVFDDLGAWLDRQQQNSEH